MKLSFRIGPRSSEQEPRPSDHEASSVFIPTKRQVSEEKKVGKVLCTHKTSWADQPTATSALLFTFCFLRNLHRKSPFSSRSAPSVEPHDEGVGAN